MRCVHVCRLMAGASLLAVLSASAQAPQAERPAVKVGDRWQFVVYYGTPSTTPNRVWLIKSLTPERIEATEDGAPLLLTPELNNIESPLRTDSNSRALSFPLRVGKTWRYENDAVFKDNRSTAHSRTEVSVVAYENVRVVAGEFDAFRLEAKSSFEGLARGGPGIVAGESSATYWYAPAAHAIVKSVSRNPYRGTSTIELVEARLQP